MSERLDPQYEAEIRERVAQLDDDRTFPGATWLASSVSSKSVFPPEQSHVVEDVVQTKHSVIRASVGVFGDKRHAEFTAHARDDIPVLLAEIDRLRGEAVTARAETFREAARLLESTGRDDDAVNLLDNMASAHEPGGTAATSARTAADVQPAAVEFGVRTPSGVLTPTHDRAEAEQRLARTQYPDAVLVQRTVRYGPWTEVPS